jgi:hypothetical protein
MPVFRIGDSVETEESSITVDITAENPLPTGVHLFQLIVTDEAGNESAPAIAQVVVRDTQAPTAVITAPSQVSFGQGFRLDGRDSSDVPPGRIVRFRWTLMR